MAWITEENVTAIDTEDEDHIGYSVRLTKNALHTAMIAIALVMIIYGVNRTFSIFLDSGGDDWLESLSVISLILFKTEMGTTNVSSLIHLPGTLMFIICGLLILLDKRRNFVRSVGFYALCMGTVRVTTAIPLIKYMTGYTGAIGWIIFLLGSNLVISGYSMLSGTTRGRMGMIAASVAMMIVYLEYIALMLALGLDLGEIAKEYYSFFISIAMYIFLIWLLDTDEIRYGDKLTRHINVLKNIDNTYRTTDILTIREKAAENLTDPLFTNWKNIEDGGPAEKEFQFVSRSKMGLSYIIVQKWKDSSDLYFTITSHVGDDIVYANRFTVTNIVRDNEDLGVSESIYLMGRDKQIIKVKIIHPADEEKYNRGNIVRKAEWDPSDLKKRLRRPKHTEESE